MREILFRGKSIYDGKWLDGDLYHRNEEVLITNFYEGFNIAVDPSTVCQFAGMLDKTGKRIFEGDVLKDDWGKVYEVFFNARNCSFMVKLEHATNEWETGNYRLGEDWSDTIRIIGNIHDNPEFLNGGEDA